MLKIISRFKFLIIILIEVICASNVKWGNDRWKEMVSFDGKGYYAYLPAFFIYHDLHFNFKNEIEKKYSSPRNYYEYRVAAGEGIINKYFVGTAISQLPFFMVAHGITILTGGSADGYSYFYMIFISIASIFYSIVGLFFLEKTLRLYNIKDVVITSTIFSIVFGTQLFYYTVFDPSLSHIYSFSAFSILLYSLKNFADNPNNKYLFLSAVILGWIFLIRPVNILVILIFPFISGSKKNFTDALSYLLKNRPALMFSFLLFILPISVQVLIYYFQSGILWPDSYPVEHFIWNRPEIINILFSYKKGFFLYTPLAFLSLAGLIFVWRKSRFAFLSFSLFFISITYVFSCWWSWWYGGSFSSRPYMEYLGIFAILFAILLSEIKRKLILRSTLGLIISLILICQVQTYQYRYYIIHWEKMDREHYWRVFMRVDQLIKHENANADFIDEIKK